MKRCLRRNRAHGPADACREEADAVIGMFASRDARTQRPSAGTATDLPWAPGWKLPVISLAIVAACALATMAHLESAEPEGAAPAGAADAVARRVLQHGPVASCMAVTDARRRPDGKIHARCDGVGYLIFSTRPAHGSSPREVALNCESAWHLLRTEC